MNKKMFISLVVAIAALGMLVFLFLRTPPTEKRPTPSDAGSTREIVVLSYGGEPIQLLSEGEVDLAAAFGARLYNAQHKDGLPVSTSWDQGVIDIEYWAILKGAKQRNLSISFINFASEPDRQAAFSSLIPLGPVNKRAFRFLSPELASQLNTHPENFSKQLILNAKFWSENEERIRERFNQWLGE